MGTKLAMAAFLLTAAGCVPAVKTAGGGPALDAASRRALAESVVDGWPKTPKAAARLMMDRYGAPDEVESGRLLWRDNGPWKRTIVRNVTLPYAGADQDDLGVIEQTVAYGLTREQAEGLAPLGDRLICDSGRGELTSRADREEVNFLRLNLANDVVRRALSAQEAKDSYENAIKLEGAGKTTQYMLSLRFGRGP